MNPNLPHGGRTDADGAPRDIEVREGGLLIGRLLGRDPAELDPLGQLDPIDPAHQGHDLGQRPHGERPMSLRGS